jgi:L-seryl-tRNA(Ser) seleniumtransferase
MLTGRADLIRRMRSNPLFRALRVDKLTYAALEATLLAYVKGDNDAIPALRMMRLSRETIGARAKAAAQLLRSSPRLEVELIDGESVVGGGAAPSATLPTRLLAIAWKGRNADELLARLRAAELPVIARIQDGRVLIDFRTVFTEQDQAVVSTLRAIADSQE